MNFNDSVYMIPLAAVESLDGVSKLRQMLRVRVNLFIYSIPKQRTTAALLWTQWN